MTHEQIEKEVAGLKRRISAARNELVQYLMRKFNDDTEYQPGPPASLELGEALARKACPSLFEAVE